eukprot:c18398_g1_i3.p1 GENE.c18398_g1_i3~~c18398_g1_i3.p1  ORF type:complete len:391 (+),score=53.85 c18398_g1_i3:845-2017(+)
MLLLLLLNWLDCACRMGLSMPARVLCSSMALLDLLFLGESRMILTDSSLLLFIALSFLCHLSAENCILHSRAWFLWTTLTGFSIGMTVSTKWTGLIIVAVIGLSTVVDMLRRARHDPLPKWEAFDFVVRLFLLLGIPIVFYVANFYAFFKQLYKTGFGADFMLPDFQASLVGHKTYNRFPAPSFEESFTYLQYEMFRANKDISTPHHWQSFWYSWPTMSRPINCWASRAEKIADQFVTRRVYLFGNPFVWWVVLGCLVVSPVCWFFHRRFSKAAAAKSHYRSALPLQGSTFAHRLVQLYLGYILSMLPYALVQRACFIYHYMPALMFGMLLAGIVLDCLVTSYSVPAAWGVLGALLLVFAWGFWFWGSLVYGLPLTNEQYQARVWWNSWV